VQSLAFGLSHIADARRAGEPVLPTVLVTGVAGWAFALLRERSGSLLAPMLAHLAINEAGAIAAISVQRATAKG
jgi:membrane protease YdiL (CAAX protease family)